MCDRDSIHVLYGQPDHLSTSYQTAQLMQAAQRHFSISERRFADKDTGRYSTQIWRFWSNLIEPCMWQPKTDYVFYANDGFADLRRWKARRIVYWYDAPWDWVAESPRPSQWRHWLRFQNIKCADYVFAVSAIQVKMARRLRAGREDSVHYLPVGVDCQTYSSQNARVEEMRQLYQIPKHRTVVGYLGYMAGLNGRFAGQPLAEIAGSLVRGREVHFLIVGFGPALADFKRFVEKEDLSSHFTFTDYVPTEHLPGLIASMDICIDTLEPGFHSEARSETKLKQYMAMGRACVATAIGENCVDLDGGECGVLVEPGPDSLRKGINTLIDDPPLRRRFGQASRQRALAFYDWPVLARRFAANLSDLEANSQ